MRTHGRGRGPEAESAQSPRYNDGGETLKGEQMEFVSGKFNQPECRLDAVSYTHLDVYKRQPVRRSNNSKLPTTDAELTSNVAMPVVRLVRLVSATMMMSVPPVEAPTL